MKIESSAVNMASARTYVSNTQVQVATFDTTSEEAAKIELSDDSKSLTEQLEEAKKAIEEQNKKRMQHMLANQKQKSNKVESTGFEGKTKKEIELQILKIMLNSFRKQNGMKSFRELNREAMRDLKKDNSDAGIEAVSNDVEMTGEVGVSQWKRLTVSSAFYAETENTAYNAQGVVRTADGREINFGVSVEMSRSFSERYESFTSQDIICTDPLVINMGSNVANVTDQKFLFDLDSDGREEQISFTDSKSGFLALDKNNDGKINNGSELFGTKSGDGFKDLAEYDKDNNGWIDENDDIFKHLKVWSKDKQGNNHLVDLKEIGVGAIYLGKASTQYSLNDSLTNDTNAIIRSTGVYLKENGEAGTIQHVDLAI